MYMSDGKGGIKISLTQNTSYKSKQAMRNTSSLGTNGFTGESSTDPTELMLVLSRKSLPIFCMISAVQV